MPLDMTVHEIRARLAADKATVGTWLQLPSPDVAELMARAGYDWVAVDMEHGSFGRTGLPDVFRAIECGGAAPFARLGEASKTQIKAALEDLKTPVEGVVTTYDKPFTKTDHDAITANIPVFGEVKGARVVYANPDDMKNAAKVRLKDAAANAALVK